MSVDQKDKSFQLHVFMLQQGLYRHAKYIRRNKGPMLEDINIAHQHQHDSLCPVNLHSTQLGNVPRYPTPNRADRPHTPHHQTFHVNQTVKQNGYSVLQATCKVPSQMYPYVLSLSSATKHGHTDGLVPVPSFGTTLPPFLREYRL